MLFSSFTFLFVFVPAVVLLFWLVPRGLPRLACLVVASCVFYGLFDWRYVPLMLAATLVDWVAGHYIAQSQDPRRRKTILVAAIALNLTLLGYFKYRGFFMDSMNGLLSLAGAGEPLPILRVFLPIGISFYTFAAISYAVDVYRGTIKPAKSVVHYLAWATLFPYITAGPIIRYEHVGQQLEHAQQRFRWALVGTGLFFLIMGLAKKLLFADMIAPYVNDLFAHSADLSLLTGWGAALGYTLQLYFDFSGYSDMAVGVAFLIGLRFPQNFNSPYKARQPLRLLAALAHDPLRLAARLPLHPARRFPGQPAADRAQPLHHVPARRPVARSVLDVRHLGAPVGRLPVSAFNGAQVWPHARVDLVEPASDLSLRRGRLGLLPGDVGRLRR